MLALLTRLFFLTVFSLLAGGCNPAANLVAGKIFSAPNKRTIEGLAFTPEVQRIARDAAAERLRVGVPGAVLAVNLISPGAYHLDWEPKVEGRRVWIDRPAQFTFARAEGTARGLVLMLHGFGCCKEQMLPWALELANQGYWVAMIDLRGHGESTGEWVGFGGLEKTDLKHVLDAVQQRSELGALPVGVLGVSYGASIGLAFAAEDARVRTVVALEPFSSAQEGIPELARAAFPEQAKQISDGLFRAAFSVGANKAGFEWASTDVVPSVARLNKPIFLVHGLADTWLAPEHSRRLYARAHEGSRLLLVPEATHVSLPVQVEKISRAVLDWFDEALHETQTVQLALSDDGSAAL